MKLKLYVNIVKKCMDLPLFCDNENKNHMDLPFLRDSETGPARMRDDIV